MREIKFRAWNGFKMYKPLLLEQNEERLFVQTGSKGIFRGDTNKQILSQFTGLQDENGKDIYEGDILEVLAPYMDKPERYKVEWRGEYSYPAFDLDGFESEMNGLSEVIETGDYNYKVIGNIFENPELLSN